MDDPSGITAERERIAIDEELRPGRRLIIPPIVLVVTLLVGGIGFLYVYFELMAAKRISGEFDALAKTHPSLSTLYSATDVISSTYTTAKVGTAANVRVRASTPLWLAWLRLRH